MKEGKIETSSRCAKVDADCNELLGSIVWTG